MHLISINLNTSSHDWQLPQQNILFGVDGEDNCDQRASASRAIVCGSTFTAQRLPSLRVAAHFPHPDKICHTLSDN